MNVEYVDLEEATVNLDYEDVEPQPISKPISDNSFSITPQSVAKILSIRHVERDRKSISMPISLNVPLCGTAFATHDEYLAAQRSL